ALPPAPTLTPTAPGAHTGGNRALKEPYPDAPLLIGVNDAPLLTDPMATLSGAFGVGITSPPADTLLREGDVVDFAGIHLEVLDIPGHSPGHIVFVYRATPCIVFGGDVLFQGSVGR